MNQEDLQDSITGPEFSAWNPGIESDLPRELRDKETIFLTANVASNYSEVSELSKQFGIRLEDLIVFHAARLTLHEVIVRVTATLVIPEGKTESELGREFRRIVQEIMQRYIAPITSQLNDGVNVLEEDIREQVADILGSTLFAAAAADSGKKAGPIGRIFGKRKKTPAAAIESKAEREYRIINTYKEQIKLAEAAKQRQIYRSLYKLLSTISSHCGHLPNDQELLTRLCTNHALNAYASRWIGRELDPVIREAAQKDGYQIAPNDPDSVLVSLKGASAAGKSSSRPALMQKYFSSQSKPYITISPDIWRRLLLDYESLASAYKYAGRLTSLEVNIIDNKLDGFIRSRAERDKAIPNILVDRFRFDSFTTDIVTHLLRNTYAKFLSTMHMVFVVTPPEETVKRGWQRGLSNGRYKSVEDFLGHSVEAYTGMPNLFLRWIKADKLDYHFEFLDNSVQKGEPPLTIASGSKQEINISRPLGFINIVRFQKINVLAKSANEIYPSPEEMAIAQNLKFLQGILQAIPTVNFLSATTGKKYAQASRGKISVSDPGEFASAMQDDDLHAIFSLIAPTLIQNNHHSSTTA